MLATIATSVAALPTINNNWCADVVETLTIDTTPPTIVPGKNYTLCVDNDNVRWNQRAADNSTWAIFNGTDFFKLAADSTAPGGWSCQTKTSGPENPSEMPYRMTTVDPGTAVNKTGLSIDSLKNVTDYWHFRQGQPPNIPNENMHWLIAPSIPNEKKQAMIATDCVQRSGMDRKGALQHGVRDFSKNYKYAFSQPILPAGIKCTPMAPPAVETAGSQNEEFFGSRAVYGV